MWVEVEATTVEGDGRLEVLGVSEAAGGVRDPLDDGVDALEAGVGEVQQAARKHGLTVAKVEDWQERFLLAAENGLRARPQDEEALKDEHIKKLKQKIGELALALDILKEAATCSFTESKRC